MRQWSRKTFTFVLVVPSKVTGLLSFVDRFKPSRSLDMSSIVGEDPTNLAGEKELTNPRKASLPHMRILKDFAG